MEVEEIKIGMRFVADDNFGTVKYVGPVPPTEGIWLGVEWDDASRGKHDGTFDGVHYFKTSSSKSGSFIRPKKADFGVKCIQAIYEKYCEKVAVTAHQEKHFIFMKNNDILPIDFVGMQKIAAKQSQLNNLREVSISNMKVSQGGEENELQRSVPNITELDLSKNLLNSWEEVAKITQQLNYLRILNISSNRLSIPDNPEMLQSSFHKVEIIVMNHMGYSWQQILKCSRMWPQIKQMTVTFNKINSISVPTNSELGNLEYLDLEGNCIQEWGEILKLGNLQMLKLINLKGNGINNVYFPNVQPNGKTTAFPSLETIILQNNEISTWEDINEMDKLSLLSNIDLQNNPLWNLDKRETVWQLIIAKIAGLKKLNRCNISPKERRDAELDYIKKYGKEWLEVNSLGEDNKNNFIRHHPRYYDLVKKYGAAEESELKTESSALKSSLIRIKLYCPQIASGEPLIKKFPGTMTVQKLRGLVQRLFKQDSQNVVLSCSSNKKPGHVVEMNNDLRELSFYVENDDHILSGVFGPEVVSDNQEKD